jgi:indolepyruvate ferredoxin oxidoreductase beta subunit
MAQRGGAVQSHLRYADHSIHSDLIPPGRTDLVLSVEPLEVLRYWHSLAPHGWVVTSVTPYVNIPDYPDTEHLLEDLAGFENIVMVDTGQLAKAAGNLRAQNMAALGAAVPRLELGEQQLLTYVQQLFAGRGEKTVEVNTRAFQLGLAAGAFFRRLVDAGMPKLSALELCRKLDPDTIDPARATAWAVAVGQDDARLSAVLASDGMIRCDQLPASA